MNTPNLITRRSFLRQAACAAVGTAGVTNALFDLRKIAAFSLGNSAALAGDYKALICLFLYGGNDAGNLIIPAGSDYAAYSAIRGTIAIPQASVLPISPLTSDGRSWGLHPNLAEVKTLFDQQKMAIMSNVGSLVEPLGGNSDYRLSSKKKPPQLFSHSDQQVQWQTSVPDFGLGAVTGWGGRMGELAALKALNSSGQVSVCISIAGNNTFQVGDTVVPYNVSTSGAAGPSGYIYTGNTGGDAIRSRAIDQLIALSHTNLFEKTFSDTKKRAIDNAALLKTALARSDTTQGGTALVTTFPTTGLGNQMKMIARLIKGRDDLNLRRQIFFVSVGGYDTHTNESTAHTGLYTELSQAMAALYAETVAQGVQDSVTTFTASDFGRTYQSNGGGSDHGWGSHHMIMGGAVKGGNLYGNRGMPTLAIGSPDDTGQGRWVPSTSVDEYAARLALWFGVSQTDIPAVLPNMSRFNTNYTDAKLGFMS
jgi:uncharacterized protein (DUF1501 family)